MPDNHEFEVMKMLQEIASDVASTKATVEGLAGPAGRVTKLEKSMESASNRQWLHSTVILPLTFAIHALLKHFNVQI